LSSVKDDSDLGKVTMTNQGHASNVLKFASLSRDMLLATHSRARWYSSVKPMSCMVSIESMTVYPIPPASVKLEPSRRIGWYSSSPIASLSACISFAKPMSYWRAFTVSQPRVLPMPTRHKLGCKHSFRLPLVPWKHPLSRLVLEHQPRSQWCIPGWVLVNPTEMTRSMTPEVQWQVRETGWRRCERYNSSDWNLIYQIDNKNQGKEHDGIKY